MNALRIVEHPTMRYVEYEGNLHEFVFYEGSRAALDQWFVYIEKFHLLPPNVRTRVFVDTTGVPQPPLAYAYQRAQVMHKKHGKRATPMYYAFLGADNQSVMNRILQTFIQLLRTGDEVRYFYGEAEREKAWAWLHSALNPDKVAEG